jgi:hypothetical protein
MRRLPGQTAQMLGIQLHNSSEISVSHIRPFVVQAATRMDDFRVKMTALQQAFLFANRIQ